MSYALEYQSMNDEINELFTNLQCVAYFMRLISDQQDAFTREVKSTCSNKKISFQRLPRVFSLTQELFHGKLPELIKSFSNIILKINPSLNSNDEIMPHNENLMAISGGNGTNRNVEPPKKSKDNQINRLVFLNRNNNNIRLKIRK